MTAEEEKAQSEQWTPALVLQHIKALLAHNDRRYEERFTAQKEAVKDALAAQEKAVNAALAAAEKAVAVAERNAEEWRKGANEWRASMTDRERNFASNKDLDALKDRMNRSEGTGKGKSDTWVSIIAVVIALAAVAAVVVAILQMNK